MNIPKAIIFDLDGVLTDTSEYHFLAWKHLTDDEGIAFTREENDAHLRGVGRRESLAYIIRNHHYSEAQVQEMMARKNHYYNELIQGMTSQEVVSGGRELLTEIRNAGIKIAIASASKNCRLVLDRLQITQYFDGIADGHCVVNSKPAADIFVFAAGLVRVPTIECLGVEDADAGIAAIKTAGMTAVAIGPRERFHHADRFLATMEHIQMKDLLGNR